ncbi:MAG: type I polyketide synthase [Rhizonema sp. PD37]|nr:type I polyketide synthase [Rhizonema sp. PD37]
MKFGLMFFATSEDALVGNKYNLVIESARFADTHGFSSIWTPERHFTKYGSLYPNPAILNAALARETQHIRLQAGSVVLPINNPIRIAEDWAIVDNLSAGRVGISLASGWNPNDFVFFPEKFKDRHQELFLDIDVLQKLWRGELIHKTNGNGNKVEIRIYPTPIQPELPIWITAASNPQTFIKAGEIGANLLTHLLDQGIEELADKISLYRQARAKHGQNRELGIVSIMVHTFVGHDFNEVRDQVRVPYCEYLKSNIGLLNSLAQSRGSSIDISRLSEKDLDDFVNFLFERFASSRGLIGTPETCLDLLEQLDNIGVDEVSCLLDFGPSKNLILSHLPHLNQLRERYNTQVTDKKHLGEKTNILLSSTQKVLLKEQLLPSMGETQTLEEIRRRCTDSRSAKEYYRILERHGLRLGGTFRSIEHLWLGKREALAQIKLDITETNSNHLIKIHPVLLEACHQVLIATLLDEMLSTNEQSLYLAVGIRNFQVYEPMSNQVWSHALLSNSVDTVNKSIEGDVRIFDQNGKLLAEVSGLQMQCAEHLSHQTKLQDRYADLFYELQWQPKTLVKLESSLVREPGNWIVFADRLGIGQSLAELLEAQGETCFVVHCSNEDRISQEGEILLDPADPKAMQELIEQMGTQHPCRGVVHLWSLNTTPSEETTISSLEKDWTLTLTSTLHLVQALIRTNASQLPQLWLVTQGTQKTGSEAVPSAIAQAPTWGLGRSLSIETPHIWGGLVDIAREFSTPDAAKALFDQIWHFDGESQIALRCEQRYVARLMPSQKVQTNPQPINLHSHATYLITGGLGHLGLNTARWMVDKGAQHIVLVGRSDASDTARQAITQLEDNGVQVLVVKADVSSQADVVRIFEKIKAYYPPVRGIFHAAGVAEFHPLQDMTPQLIKSVLDPKVAGTWNLHQITLGMKLDFFVCISSIASVWGSEGLGHYAAASHFLDIFAHYRHSLKLPALTVNVGALADGGMHHRHQKHTVMREQITQIGLKYYSPQALLKMLEYSLEIGVAQQVIIDIDWAIFKELYEARERRTLLKQIKVQLPKPLKGQLEQLGGVLHQLKNASKGDQYDILLAYVQNKVARILKLEDSRLPTPEQNLTLIGMDSLTAMELKNNFQNELGIDIPTVKFLEGTTIAALANELAQKNKEREIEFSGDEKLSETGDKNSSWIEGEI